MSDDIRRRVTDPDEVAAFGRRAREAAERALREDDPEISDERIAEILQNAGPPRVIWASRRERRNGTERTTVEDHGVATTPDELARLRRRLPGGANRGGRAPGTNAVDDAGGDEAVRTIVAELRRNHRRVTLNAIATASGVYSRDNLRLWLRTNGKRLSDYLPPG